MFFSEGPSPTLKKIISEQLISFKISEEKKLRFFSTQKLLKVTISLELTIGQKKSFMRNKEPGQFQSTLQIWSLLKKVVFLGAQNACFELISLRVRGAQTRNDISRLSFF